MTDTADGERWALTLYVNGASARSIEAIETVRRICDEELSGHVDLEIIDVQQQPALVLRDQIIAAPTLIRRLPGPLRRIVGDLSDSARLRLGSWPNRRFLRPVIQPAPRRESPGKVVLRGPTWPRCGPSCARRTRRSRRSGAAMSTRW